MALTQHLIERVERISIDIPRLFSWQMNCIETIQCTLVVHSVCSVQGHYIYIYIIIIVIIKYFALMSKSTFTAVNNWQRILYFYIKVCLIKAVWNSISSHYCCYHHTLLNIVRHLLDTMWFLEQRITTKEGSPGYSTLFCIGGQILRPSKSVKLLQMTRNPGVYSVHRTTVIFITSILFHPSQLPGMVKIIWILHGITSWGTNTLGITKESRDKCHQWH